MPPAKVKKILIISLYFRGDVLFNTAAIKMLKRIYPDAEIDVLVKSRSAEVLNGNTDINRLIVFDDIKTADYNDCNEIKAKKKLSLLKKLRKENFDLCADLTGKYSTALIALFGGFKYTFGLNYNGFGFCYSKFIDVNTQNTNGHLVDKYLNTVKEGLNIDDNKRTEFKDDLYGKCFINLSDPEISEAEKVLNSLDISLDNQIICIQTTAGWSAKEWDESNYSVLLEKFRTSGYSYILIGSENDKEKNNRILDSLHGEQRKYFLPLPLKINAAVIRLSDLFIGSDSIGLHIAGAVDTPSIGLFGPTNPAFSNPPGDLHRVIYKKLNCSAPDDKQYCTRDAGKSCKTKDCLKNIDTDEVMMNVEFLLNKRFKRKGVSA